MTAQIDKTAALFMFGSIRDGTQRMHEGIKDQ
jgi:hypothetical protein